MPDYLIAVLIFAVLFGAALLMHMHATRPRRRR
jgi:Na+/H+-dicarboxylate symporter